MSEVMSDPGPGPPPICPYCHGGGMVPIFDRRYDGRAVEMRRYTNQQGEPAVEHIAMRAVTYCLCPIGAKLRARAPAEITTRMPDLAAVLEDRTRWTITEPPSVDESGGRWP